MIDEEKSFEVVIFLRKLLIDVVRLEALIK